MSENKPSVLITGANGFVGARLCRTFLGEGFDVIAGVRRTSNLSQIEGLEISYRYGDVNEPESLATMVSGVDYIVHNAGVTKAKEPETFFEVNERGTQLLFEAIAKYNPDVKKVVMVSSLAAAGPSTGREPLTEDVAPKPISIYGQSKLAGEKVALSFADKFSVTAVRPPGVYGPGDREILSFFQTVNGRIKPYIGNTGRRLQLVHVDDLCRGIYGALTGDTKTCSVYYIAEDRSYSMRELISLLETACGKRAFPVFIPGSIFKLIAAGSKALFKLFGATPMLTPEKARELLASWEVSTAKAREDFGYKSQISFEEGARQTYQWYKKEGWL